MALKRDTEKGMVFGVCAGLAKHLGMDLGLLRVLTVISFLLTGSITFWAYIIAAIVLPVDNSE